MIALGADHAGHGGHHHGGHADGGPVPSMLEMLTTWHTDWWVLGFAALLLGGYAAGVVVLRGRGDRWSAGRSVTWVAGVASLLAVTANGIGSHGMALFSVHMVQHMVIGMLTPILLLAGAPVTLALRALPTGRGVRGAPRRAVLWFLHSRLTRVVSAPVVTVGAFVASLYALYFTPVLDAAMSSHAGHLLMLLHFLLVGLLFFGPILAVDPWPRRSSAGRRLLEMLVAVPFHAFFGIAVMSATSPLSSRFAEASRQLGVDVMDDQWLGGGIAWGFGEVPIVLVTGLVFAQWVAEDGRTARRHDRQAARDDDAELAAYNARLRGLAHADATR